MTQLGPDLVAGLDVGTTFTGVAVVRSGQQAEAVSLGRQRVVMPSVVWVGPEGETQVGEAAVRRAVSDGNRVARLFKPLVGSDRPIPLGSDQVSVERLLAALIEAALDAVRAQFGADPGRVALTFPASWGPYRQGILVDGARLCGLDEPMLVTEPEAAAAFYSTQRDVPEGSLVAVFDFGGGTLDIAVVHRVAGGFELLGQPMGDDQLGGAAIDNLVLDHVERRLAEHGVTLDQLDPAGLAGLERECIEAKEALSFDDYADIPVALPGGHQTVRITRAEFDLLVAPLVDRCHEVLMAALTAADVDPNELSAVLLVGGSSRIPLVASTLSSRLACEVAVNADPKTAVALGAAELAANPPPEVEVSGADAGAVELGIPGLVDPVLIGSGGYSLVYRARQTSFDRDVAVKVVTGGGFDLTARRQFERECRTIGRLSEHPNIVTVYDSGVPVDRPPYLVMAYLAQGSMQDRLAAGGAYSWQEAIDVTMKIGDALQQAHEAGIVHCDVKPANILISTRGEPQLADFGLARVAERTGTQSIMGLVGTPHYSPPELFDGAAPAPTRDIYSLAATGHAMMSGEPPIGAGSTNVLSLMRQVVSDPPSDLRPLGVPDAVAEVIERGMAKTAEDRPASMAQFLAELQAAATGGTAPPRAAATPPSSPAQPGSVVSPPAPAAGGPPLGVPGGPPAPPSDAPAVDSTMELRSALPFDEASGEVPPRRAAVTEDVSGPQTESLELPPMASGQISPAEAPVDSGPLGAPPLASPEGPGLVGPGPAIDPPSTPPGDSRIPRKGIVVGLGVLLAGIAGVVAFTQLSGDDSASPVTSTSSSTTAPTTTAPTTTGSSATSTPSTTVDRLTGVVAARSIVVGDGPWTPAFDGEALWVPIDGGVVRADVGTGQTETISIEGWTETPLVAAGSVWVPNISQPTLTRISLDDPTTEPVTITVGNRGFLPVFAHDAVWVPNRDDSTISRVDVATNEATTIDLGTPGVTLATINGDVWVSTTTGLFSLDADGSPTQISDFVPRGAAVEVGGMAWVTEAESGNIVRIDPATGAANLIDVGGGAGGLAAGSTGVWFLIGEEVQRLDAATGVVTSGASIEGPTILITPFEDGAWVVTRAEVPTIYVLDDELEIVAQQPAVNSAGVAANPDTAVAIDDRAFVSLTREGAEVLELRAVRDG